VCNYLFYALGRHSPSEYVVIIATSSAVRGASARSRFQYLAGRADSSIPANVWAAVVEMIRDRPIWVHVPATPPSTKFTHSTSGLVLMPECLFDPAEVAVETGLIGLACFIWLLLVYLTREYTIATVTLYNQVVRDWLMGAIATPVRYASS